MSREFGNSLGSFRNGVFGEFSGESELDSGLNFSGAHGVFLVISNKSGGFLRKSVEGVRNERVHDGHGFLGDTSVRVHLLEHLVDIGAVAFGTTLLLLLVASLLGGLCRFLGRSLSHCRGWEGEQM